MKVFIRSIVLFTYVTKEAFHTKSEIEEKNLTVFPQRGIIY